MVCKNSMRLNTKHRNVCFEKTSLFINQQVRHTTRFAQKKKRWFFRCVGWNFIMVQYAYLIVPQHQSSRQYILLPVRFSSTNSEQNLHIWLKLAFTFFDLGSSGNFQQNFLHWFIVINIISTFCQQLVPLKIHFFCPK